MYLPTRETVKPDQSRTPKIANLRWIIGLTNKTVELKKKYIEAALKYFLYIKICQKEQVTLLQAHLQSPIS